MKIFRMAEISRILTNDPRQIRADYSGKMYREAIEELRDFQEAWEQKWGKNKTSETQQTTNKSGEHGF